MKKKISFYLSDDEYQYLLSQSESCNCSINAYIKRKALDRTDTSKLQKEAALLMTDLYRWSQMTEDLKIRALLNDGGDRLCRCLRW